MVNELFLNFFQVFFGELFAAVELVITNCCGGLFVEQFRFAALRQELLIPLDEE